MVPLLVLVAAAPIVQAALAATRAQFPVPAQSTVEKLQRWMLTFYMHLVQPVARLIGRIKHGLTPWRRRGQARHASPWPREETIWSEAWESPEVWMERIESALRAQGAVVSRGGALDVWDLQVRGGMFGSIKCLVAIEEHGAGRQLLRIGSRPRVPMTLVVVVALLVALAGLALLDSAWIAAGGLAFMAAALCLRAFHECQAAAGAWTAAVERVRPGEPTRE